EHHVTVGGCTIVDSRGNCLESDVVTPDQGYSVPGRQSPSFTFNPLGWEAKLLIMRTVDLIKRKRGGEERAPEAVDFLVNEYTSGEIPEFQMSAFLMAVYFKGITDREASRRTE